MHYSSSWTWYRNRKLYTPRTSSLHPLKDYFYTLWCTPWILNECLILPATRDLLFSTLRRLARHPALRPALAPLHSATRAPSSMAPAISWGFLHSLIWALTRSIEIPHIVHNFHIIVASLLYFKRVVFYFCVTLPAVYRSLIGKYCLDYKLLSNINFGSNHIYGVWLCSLPLLSRHLPWLLVIPLRWLSSRRTIIWRALRVWYSVHRAKRTIINKFESAAGLIDCAIMLSTRPS